MIRNVVFILAFLFISCTSMTGNVPDKNIWRQDDLFCWHKSTDGRWQVIGPNNKCPTNTQYVPEPPN